MLECWQLTLEQYAHFHFLRPWWLLGLLTLLLVLPPLRPARNPLAKWQSVIAPHLLRVMVVRHGRASWFNPLSVSIVLWVLLMMALAGPAWKQQSSPFSEDIAALVIVLDVSSSMQQQDIQPTRLERAKQKVQDLMALRPGGQVGLIVYAGTAHSVIPLTNDAQVINNFLSAIQTGMMPRIGKFPEKALVIAERMLMESPVPGTLLLITDGLGPESLTDFENYFSANQHQLLVLGVGSEQAGEVDNDAWTPLESAALARLAARSGGYYRSLSIDKADVKSLSRRIANHLVIVDEDGRPWVDEGYYLLFPIALIWLLWFRSGWTLNWCIAVIFLASLASPKPLMASDSAIDIKSVGERFIGLWLTPNQQGRYYLERGEYQKAARSFEDINWRGIAYYRAEKFAAAAEMFSRIETADGQFNLANALAHDRHYVLAVKTFDSVLQMQPAHKSAMKNRDFVQAIIDEINLLSASQKSEDGTSSRELSEGEPQTADGAVRDDVEVAETEQLTAEQILLDEQLNETWMRQVQKDPARFLSVKFHMQLQRREGNEN
ncbi:MAG: VWA domain-containing protein [Gammaproteobacteria bacterium]|nr:VWA domain-containing protein [Gammaproteobacteria bacterium]